MREQILNELGALLRDNLGQRLTPALATGIATLMNQAIQLLLRPDEVLSGIPDAPVLEVADNALGVLFQAHHVRVGGLA